MSNTCEENRPPEVLVVDDCREIRYCISLVLRANGYRVLEAQDGLEAQLILASKHPALVLTDLEMPVSDGWDVLNYCHEHCPEVPVIIVSGNDLGQQPAIERWAAGFVQKPFSGAQLCGEVQRLVSRAA